MKEPAFTVPTLPFQERDRQVRPEKIASVRRLFCGFAAQPPANVMRAEHGCAFWATLAGNLLIWLARWIDDIRPLGGRYSSLDVDDGCTRQVEADFLGLGGNAGRLISFPAFLFGSRRLQLDQSVSITNRALIGLRVFSFPEVRNF